eukprot:GHVS01013344.1.p1 GENE.GHVS01013344.1~~GHVS01013344.1.p1  ORF type:complete len:810 (-),score=126.21 GHVS01013344.1:408-2837(-)
MQADDCIVHIMYDAKIAPNGEIEGGDGNALCLFVFQPYGEEAATVNIGTDGMAVSRIANATSNQSCRKVLWKAQAKRVGLFSSSVQRDPDLLAALDLPYGFANLLKLARQIEAIDSQSDKLRQMGDGTGKHHLQNMLMASFTLMASINAAKGNSILPRLKSISTNAYEAVQKGLTTGGFSAYVQDKEERGLIAKSDCVKYVGSPAMTGTGDSLHSFTLALESVCSEIFGFGDVTDRVAELTKESKAVQSCYKKVTCALKELYAARHGGSATIDAKVEVLHAAANCMWQLGKGSVHWIFTQLAQMSPPKDDGTDAMHQMWKETAQVYVGGGCTEEQWTNTVECARRLRAEWPQLKKANDELTESMAPPVFPEIDAAIYPLTRRLLVEEFNQQTVESAGKCTADMTAAMDALVGAAAEVDVVEKRVGALHAAAACVFRQNRKGSIVVRRKLVTQADYKSGKISRLTYGALYSKMTETIQLYTGGFELSEEQWQATLQCSARLATLWKQLSMVSHKGQMAEVEWMASPLCSNYGDIIYSESSRDILRLFNQQIIKAAATMVGINREKWYTDINEQSLKPLTNANAVVTESIRLSTTYGDGVAPQAALDRLKSIAAIWAMKATVLNNVQLIGWSLLLAYTRAVRRDKGVDTITEADGKKGEEMIDPISASVETILESHKQNAAVKRYQSLKKSLEAWQRQWDGIRQKYSCYGEMANDKSVVADEKELVADVFKERWSRAADDPTDVEEWFKNSNDVFSKELQHQVVSNLLKVAKPAERVLAQAILDDDVLQWKKVGDVWRNHKRHMTKKQTGN